jgi:hypothetical protein
VDHEAGGVRPLHDRVHRDLLQPARRPGGAARQRDQAQLQLDVLQVQLLSYLIVVHLLLWLLLTTDGSTLFVWRMQQHDQQLERRRLLHAPHHPQARRQRPPGLGVQRRHRREDPRDGDEAHPQQARAQDHPGLDAVVRPLTGNDDENKSAPEHQLARCENQINLTYVLAAEMHVGWRMDDRIRRADVRDDPRSRARGADARAASGADPLQQLPGRHQDAPTKAVPLVCSGCAPPQMFFPFIAGVIRLRGKKMGNTSLVITDFSQCSQHTGLPLLNDPFCVPLKMNPPTNECSWNTPTKAF